MREIKFRAWDKQCEVNGMIMQDNRTLGTFFDHEVYPTDNYELMQYTGLKDKNGVEIYEGDIVEIENELHQMNRLVVEYGIATREMASGWIVDIPSFYFKLIENGFQAFPILVNWNNKHDLEMMEVTGNIYSNPELVNGLADK